MEIFTLFKFFVKIFRIGTALEQWFILHIKY